MLKFLLSITIAMGQEDNAELRRGAGGGGGVRSLAAHHVPPPLDSSHHGRGTRPHVLLHGCVPSNNPFSLH